jgi:hypothetical protein
MSERIRRAIDEQYARVDGRQLLGADTGVLTQQGGWTGRKYERGGIYHHPRMGTHAVYGPAYDLWSTRYAERLGFPTSDFAPVSAAGDVLVMRFEHGAMIWERTSNSVAVSSKPALKGLLPAVEGTWEIAFDSGAVGIHAALLHTNKILFWGDDQDGPLIPIAGTSQQGEWALLNLGVKGQVASKHTMSKNVFCAGQCLLGDGRLLVVGGDRGSAANNQAMYIFNPTTEDWVPEPALPSGRWYPTVVTWSANRAVIVAGDAKPDPHINYRNSSAQMCPIGPSDWPIAFDPDLKQAPGSTYPFVFLLPDGRLFVHLADRTRIVKDLTTAESQGFNAAVKLVDSEGSRTYPRSGTAVLLPLRPNSTPPYRARVLLIGGGNGDHLYVPAKKTCAILDFGAPGPAAWKPAAPMENPRVLADAVLLPDGKVLAVNGGATGKSDAAAPPVYEAELYDPETGKWTTLAAMSVPRLYHSTALLLPDARVMTAGTDPKWNESAIAAAEKDLGVAIPIKPTAIEVFSPPYLYHGPRPTLKWAPDAVSFGATFDVATPDDASIKSAVLLRNGSCTHGFNSDQRFVELEIVQPLASKLWVVWRKVSVRIGWGGPRDFRVPGGFVERGLRLKAPPNRFVAPPGYYMLFLVSQGGVPSIASFVRVGA